MYCAPHSFQTFYCFNGAENFAMDNHQLPTSSPNTDVQNAQFDLQVNYPGGSFGPVYLFFYFIGTCVRKLYNIGTGFLAGYSSF